MQDDAPILRPAARVLFFDAHDRVLLFRANVGADDSASWYRAPVAAQRPSPCTECAEMRSVMSAQAELMRHPGLTPMQKLVGSAVAYEYASAASRGLLNEVGIARIRYHAIGERIGIAPNPETGRISS